MSILETGQQVPASDTGSDSGTGKGRRASRGLKDSRRWMGVGLPLGVGVILLALWKMAADREWVDPILLPPPGDVWSALNRGVVQGTWWEHIQTTMTEVVLGFVIGVAAGLVIGAVFAFVDPIRIAFYPYVLALQSFPKLAIAPLLVVILGYGIGPKVLVAALLAYFPVMTAAYAGFTEVNPDEHNLMRSMGANRLEEMRFLRLPNAMSYLFPSFDVALIVSLLGAVGAELVGAQSGLGALLMERQSFGDTASIFAVIFILIAIGLLLKGAITLVRNLLPRSILPR